MENNSGEVLLLFMGFLIAGAIGQNRQSLPTLDIESIADEFHKLAGVIDKIDNLSMMARKSDEHPDFALLPTPQNDSSLPNLNSIADALAPILHKKIK